MRSLEPQVAHLRLQWWQDEARRARQGTPEHPWLRALPTPLDLSGLIHAAVQDLHTTAPGTALPPNLHRALFVELANQFDAGQSAHPERRELVRQLADLTLLAPEAAAAATVLPAAWQPALAPLLVWAHMAMRQSRRGERNARPGIVAMLGDNLSAWYAARRAHAGRFSLR